MSDTGKLTAIYAVVIAGAVFFVLTVAGAPFGLGVKAVFAIACGGLAAGVFTFAFRAGQARRKD